MISTSVPTLHTAHRNYGLGLGMPTISLGSFSGSSSGSSLLPTVASGSRQSSSSIFGGTRRRTRRWVYPLILCSLGAVAYITLGQNIPDPDDALFTGSHNSPRVAGVSIAASGRTWGQGGKVGSNRPNYDRHNGLSLLDDDDILIPDEELYLNAASSPAPHAVSEDDAEQAKRKAEYKERQLVVEAQERHHQLLALVYFVAQGGILDTHFDRPDKSMLKKIGGSGLEKLLVKSDLEWAAEMQRGEGGDDKVIETFEQGWQEFAKKSYRLVVFSKSYCPYSRNAKRILATYDLAQDPLIVELDQRTDGLIIQSLLQSLTGRRTVPNVILDLEPIGGSDEIELFHSEGGLKTRFEEAKLMRQPDYRQPLGGRPGV